MAFDYLKLRDKVVIPQLADKGKPGQISINVPATGAEPYESQLDGETLYPVTVFQSSFKKSDNKGTVIEMGDIMLLVSPDDVTIDPELADRIIVDGITYQAVRIDPVKPGSTLMLWYFHARK